jgi:heat shock protein HtpX
MAGALTGYVAHAAANRRQVWWMVALYVIGFELVGAFALILPLMFFDVEHSILTDPAGYGLRYALPIAVLALLLFRRYYAGHAKAVTQRLGVRIVERADEARFVALAESACTTLGVRCPRFGVIEVSAPNALTVGEGPARGLIAVTRGLLDALDDDELSAVLAHEASHIRQGDTKVLAANYALMRTAVAFQTHNALRFEDWRQLIIVVFLPPFLLLMLASGAATGLAMKMARMARRGLKLSRDHIADGEAIRVTHFPEALVSALGKIGGKGAFAGSWQVEGLLFDGPADHEGGSHPSAKDRIEAITTLGHSLMDPARKRRDTRREAGSSRGPRPATEHSYFRYGPDGKPVAPPAQEVRMLLNAFTNPRLFAEWQQASIAWMEWRIGDERNLFGLKPMMAIQTAAVAAFLIVFHWPADNDPRKMLDVFGPAGALQIANFDQSCNSPIGADGLCHDNEASAPGTFAKSAKVTRHATHSDEGPPAIFSSNDGHPDFGLMLVPLMMVAFMIIIPMQKLRPEWFRWLTHPGGTPDAVRPIPDPARERRPLPPVSITAPPVRAPGNLDAATRPAAPVRGFGRKGV